MKTIDLYLFDSKKIDDNLIKSLPFLRDEDFVILEEYTTLLGKQEKALSLYFKRKYIGDYSINQYGKPLSDSAFFNISHSNGIVIFTKTNLGPIGIDIEQIRPVSKELITGITTNEELQSINSPEDFFKLWTCKESLLKSNGRGIIRNLKSVPALPYNGTKIYNQVYYFSQVIKNSDYIIAVTIQSKEDFKINIIQEEINP